MQRCHAQSLAMGPLVTRRLRAREDFRLEDWAADDEPLPLRIAAMTLARLADAAGYGDNLHAVLEPAFPR